MIAFSKGQSLSEYLLLGGLITIVSIAALLMLAGDFSASLPELLDRIFNGGGNGLASSAMANASSKSSSSYLPSQYAETEGLGPVQFTLSNGSTITLEEYPRDIPSVVETAGGNGTTEILLANLEEIIRQLIEAEEITPEQANSLMDLSNAGHEVAFVQKEYEDILISTPDFGNLNADGTLVIETLNTEGETVNYWDSLITLGMNIDGPANYYMPAEEFLTRTYLQCTTATHCDKSEPIAPDLNATTSSSNWMVWGSFDPSLDDLSNSNSTTITGGSALNSFAVEYGKAASDGALESPIVKEIVDALASEILKINSDLTSTAYPNVLAEGEAESATNSTFQEKLVSKITHRNSGGICEVGGDTDSGIQCQ